MGRDGSVLAQLCCSGGGRWELYLYPDPVAPGTVANTSCTVAEL